jgi:hypothetical protein
LSAFDPKRTLAVEQDPAGRSIERDRWRDSWIAWIAPTVEPQAGHVRPRDATPRHSHADIAPAACGGRKQPDRKLCHGRPQDHPIAASLRAQDNQRATAAATVASVGHIHERFGPTVTVKVSFRSLVTFDVQRPVNEPCHTIARSRAGLNRNRRRKS